MVRVVTGCYECQGEQHLHQQHMLASEGSAKARKAALPTGAQWRFSTTCPAMGMPHAHAHRCPLTVHEVCVGGVHEQHGRHSTEAHQSILGSTMVRDGLGWEAGVQVGRASSAGRRFCGEGASWAIKYVTERFRPTQAQPVGQTPELAAPRTWSCAAGR